MEIQGASIPAAERPAAGWENIKDIFAPEYNRQMSFPNDIMGNTGLFGVEVNERSDKAELSPECVQDAAEREEILKQLEKLSAQIESLKSASGVIPEKELEQLKKLYRLMLEKIMQLPEPEIQKIWFSKLDVQVLKEAEQYAAENLNIIDGFFRQFGSSRDSAKLINSLFKVVTGRGLNPDKIIRALNLYNKNTFMKGCEQNEHHSEGILYPRSVTTEKMHFKDSPFSEKKLADADYMTALRHNSLKETDRAKSFTASSHKYEKIFSTRDLKIAEQFLEDFLGKDNLLEEPQITSCNPEVKGLLAAATWLKANTFLHSSGIQKGLQSSIAQSVDKMINYYISCSGDKRGAVKSGKENPVYTLYYKLRLICQKETNAGKALTSVLKYAYEQFEKHNSDENFFFLHSPSAEHDFEKGFMLLKRNWKRFTETLLISMRAKKDLDNSFYSPWGMYMHPASPLLNFSVGKPAFIGGAVLIGIILSYIMFV